MKRTKFEIEPMDPCTQLSKKAIPHGKLSFYHAKKGFKSSSYLTTLKANEVGIRHYKYLSHLELKGGSKRQNSYRTVKVARSLS